ncbi:cytochrome C [Pseudomonas sp. 3MA1]|uniref:cytochrome C n=1 Tax=Pseudomonas sp. 3MA1 TaxID=2699196 RepID=UPI000CDA3292|nr:cytochrome C [Pseudomonas sp. 3MA1]MDF2396887.1 cytochrome C [Pseudomonas sp. 3MA1]RBJ81179.1 cytochrome C [Pseudomonas sp. MWU12-2534b]
MKKEVYRPGPRFGCALCGALLSPLALALAPPDLSSHIPYDVAVTAPPTPTLESLQRDFDVLSWQTFIALNWPAQADGSPGTGPIGKEDGPTVWESWKESYQIFRAKGEKPLAWEAPAILPKPCEGLKSGRLLQQMGKVAGVLDEFIQPFQSGPLVDQSGTYTRNEIVVNRPMFNDIVDKGLYSVQGQQAYFAASPNNRVAFSCSSNPHQKLGAIMVKASWKVLDGNDQRSRFHTVDALVYTPGNSDPTHGPIVEESCKAEAVGLVGLHIVHKTALAPQWVWSTFEHVDNVPEKTTPPEQRKGPYLFYNAASPAKVNEPPPRPWNPAVKATPSQIVREIPLTEAAKALNSTYQALLRTANPQSVWANYQMIDTQWPADPAPDCETPSPTNPLGSPAPTFLANATLETFIQGTVPQASSSCMDCHNNATTRVTQNPRTTFADFTYLLERAQSTGAAGSKP